MPTRTEGITCGICQRRKEFKIIDGRISEDFWVAFEYYETKTEKEILPVKLFVCKRCEFLFSKLYEIAKTKEEERE